MDDSRHGLGGCGSLPIELNDRWPREANDLARGWMPLAKSDVKVRFEFYGGANGKLAAMALDYTMINITGGRSHPRFHHRKVFGLIATESTSYRPCTASEAFLLERTGSTAVTDAIGRNVSPSSSVV